MTYRQDDSYALDRHVSASIRGLLLRRFCWPQAWATIQNLWRWAMLDSRMPEVPAGRLQLLQSGRCFIDPWSASAMETLERTWPELAAAFRGRSSP